MNAMAATLTAQAHAKAQRDMEKREREILAAGSRVLTSFNHQSPPKYNGEGGPDAADLWLQAMEKISGAIHCPEGEKVTLATYQLSGGSEYWWKSTSLMMEAAHEEINWVSFKRNFLAKYFPETARERYGEEFLRLRQGGMNVEAYAKKFESLSRFFRFFRDGVDETYMCRRFQDGLRYELQDSVIPLGIRNFQVLVDKCQEIEDMKNKRVNRNVNSTAGGPSRPSNQAQNRGRRGNKPYNRPQNNQGQDRSVNQGNPNAVRQRRWMETLKDFDFTLQYHPGKANVVADALSRKSVSVCSAQMASQQELLEEFRGLHLEVEFTPGNLRLGMITISNGLMEDIASCQNESLLMEKRALIDRGTTIEFKVGSDNILRCNGRVCVPDAKNLRNTVLEEAHKSKLSIHPGATKMYQDLRLDYWWPGMKRHVAEYVASCLTCQKAKVEHQKPAGMLQSLDIPEWKWNSISMDFITGLPKTRRKHDSIWVIVDRLTKSAHFLPVRITDTVEKLTDIYVAEIVRLHGIPSSIVSDRDPKFTSHFWRTLHEALGTKLRLSSAYHPQTDGQTERTNQSLEDLLRACVLDDRGSWDNVLPLIEFTYNNSFHTSIGMAPYEALYGRRCQTPLCWYQDGESMIVGPEMVQQTTDKVRKIRARMKVAQDRQKSYADRRRRPLEFEAGEHVFLRVTPTTGVGRAIKARKLTPKFIGPYQITEKIGKVAYRIALPPILSQIHDVFHVSQLRKYVPDPSHVITPDDIQLKENLSFEVPPVKIADRKMKRLRTKDIPLVKIIWNEATGDATWEIESKMKEQYPELFSDV
ncbi:hypothetical protein QL285_021436 [Trifolium repens]|nr:hypothetical protein QL285_021436 [Trifolium repens]